MNNVKDLNRVNRIVFKKYCKHANDMQRAKMRTTLKEQIQNLEILLQLMNDNI